MARQQLIGGSIGIKHYLMVEQGLYQFEEVAQAALVDDEAIEGITDRHSAGLGIADNLTSHF